MTIAQPIKFTENCIKMHSSDRHSRLADVLTSPKLTLLFRPVILAMLSTALRVSVNLQLQKSVCFFPSSLPHPFVRSTIAAFRWNSAVFRSFLFGPLLLEGARNRDPIVCTILRNYSMSMTRYTSARSEALLHCWQRPEWIGSASRRRL